MEVSSDCDPVEHFAVMLAILWRASNLWRPTVNCDPVERWKARHPVEVRNPMDFILLPKRILVECLQSRGMLELPWNPYQVWVATLRVVRLQRGVRFAT